MVIPKEICLETFREWVKRVEFGDLGKVEENFKKEFLEINIPYNCSYVGETGNILQYLVQLITNKCAKKKDQLLKIFEFILGQNSNLEVKTSDLVEAAGNFIDRPTDNNKKLLELLFQAEINPNAIDEFGYTALHSIIARFSPTPSAEKLRNFTSILSMFLEHGADINAKVAHGNYEGYTFLNSCRSLELFKILFVKGVKLNESDHERITEAAETADIDILSLLLKKGVDINYKDSTGKTALMTVIEEIKRLHNYNKDTASHIEILKFLLTNGANIDLEHLKLINETSNAQDEKLKIYNLVQDICEGLASEILTPEALSKLSSSSTQEVINKFISAFEFLEKFPLLVEKFPEYQANKILNIRNDKFPLLAGISCSNPTKDEHNKSSLSDLPQEIRNKIFSYLKFSDIKNLDIDCAGDNATTHTENVNF